MTGDAVQGWAVACSMTKIAQDLGVLPFQRPWMPRLVADWCGHAQRKERTPLGHSVTDRAGTREYLSCLTDVAIIMTPKAPGPVTVTDVVGIGGPVHSHGRENVPLVNGK